MLKTDQSTKITNDSHLIFLGGGFDYLRIDGDFEETSIETSTAVSACPGRRPMMIQKFLT